jgi:dGTP triphosphohydrolase
MLDECMKGFGGFSHNRQSLRVVDILERRSPEYFGLNLTVETKDSLRKHETVTDLETGQALRFPLLEAQLVDLADSTAYHYHDVDDGIREKILNPSHMEKELPLWAMSMEAARKRHPNHDDDFLMWRRAANELLGRPAEKELPRAQIFSSLSRQPISPLEAQSWFLAMLRRYTADLSRPGIRAIRPAFSLPND